MILLTPGYRLGAEDQDTRPADARQSLEPNPYLLNCGSTGSLLPTGVPITLAKLRAFFLLTDLMVLVRLVYLHPTRSVLDKRRTSFPPHIFPSERTEAEG